MLRRIVLAGLVVFLSAMFCFPAVFAREWTDDSGSFKVEAKVLTVKGGKVYLEKSSGDVVPVPLERLSKEDLEYLVSLPEFDEYFAANPVPGLNIANPIVQLKVDDESHVGEIRRFSDLGWGVKSLAFSPNGALLAAGKMDKALMVFDLNKSQRVSFHEKLDGLDQVTTLAFTPDGKKLLSGGYRGRIQIWNVGRDGQLTVGGQFVGHSEEISAISVSRDGQHVLSGSKEKKTRYWDVETGREQFVIDGFRGGIKATYLTRNGKQGLACDGETLTLIDIETGKSLQSIKLASSSTQAVAIAPDGSLVAVSDTYTIRLWDIQTGEEKPILQDREIQWSLAFSPNGRYLISGGQGKVNLWDTDSARKLYEFDTAGTYYIQCLAFSPDKRHIAAIPGSAGQSLQVFRLPGDVVMK